MIDTILQPGKETGFSTVEVFRERAEKEEYERFGDGKVAHHKASTDRVNVRAFWDTGDPVGFHLSNPDDQAVYAAFARVYATRLPDQKENYAAMLPAQVKKVDLNVWDSSLEEVDDSRFLDLTERLNGALVRFPGLRLKRIYLSRELKRVYLANTNGLFSKYKKTLFNLVLSITHQGNLIDVGESKAFFHHLEPLKVLSRASNLLESLTENRARVEKNCFFILAPEASCFMLREFSEYLKLDGQAKKIDFSFPSILNVVDDPVLDQQVGSVPFDDEGTQGKERFLVRKGIFNDVISNIQTAFENGNNSSGNGFRGEKSIFPGVGFSNLYIKPTVLSLKNLMKDADKGILISLIRLKRVDQDKYLFSAYGYRFSGGELKEPVHLLFRTSFISYFLNIIKVSKELKFFNNAANIGSPYILVEALGKPGDIFEI